MPEVHRWPEPMAPTGLLASWSSAVIAVPLTLLISAAGQGLGALAAGGGWIGLAIPCDRQPWALVNQPVLNFASLPSAGGYWLGSTALPLALALGLMPLSLRLRSLAAQLFVVQLAWTAAVVGLGWQPLLDPAHAHVARWLGFRGLPLELRWLVGGAAAAAAVPVALRLIALARIARFHLGRGRRLLLVALHLLPAPVAWAVASSLLGGAIPPEAAATTALVVLTALAVAWFGFPPPITHRVTPATWRAVAVAVAGAMLAAAVFWVAGRPLPDDRAAAVQWGRAGSFNNVRQWMEPDLAPWLEPTRIGSAPPPP